MAQKIGLLEQKVQNNQVAADILEDLIQKGDAVQDAQGRVSVVPKPQGMNDLWAN